MKPTIVIVVGFKVRIRKSITCSSANVVYLAQCVDCSLFVGVGSSVNQG